jgi:hypothetical protein
METMLKLYAVRNKDGKWMRSKGYEGSGEKWVDDLKKAKIYPKPGPARAQVTYWAENYPEFGVPDLVELHVNEVVVINEDMRVEKSIKDKVLKHERLELDRKQREIDRLSEELASNKKRLNELRSKNI